jgi:hypothetical protein
MGGTPPGDKWFESTLVHESAGKQKGPLGDLSSERSEYPGILRGDAIRAVDRLIFHCHCGDPTGGALNKVGGNSPQSTSGARYGGHYAYYSEVKFYDC